MKSNVRSSRYRMIACASVSRSSTLSTIGKARKVKVSIPGSPRGPADSLVILDRLVRENEEAKGIAFSMGREACKLTKLLVESALMRSGESSPAPVRKAWWRKFRRRYATLAVYLARQLRRLREAFHCPGLFAQSRIEEVSTTIAGWYEARIRHRGLRLEFSLN